MISQAPKGTRDVYGDEMRIWRKVEEVVRALTDVYGYTEIRTPIFEHTDLFLRGVGDTTDIVQKEMYTFNDKAGRSISLRPELTAGVARAYVERGMHNNPQPTKLFYIGPNFRYENPQAGRYRQHSQFGVEIFGPTGAVAEAEIISLGHTLITRLGVEGVTLHINSIGCSDCRAVYQERLKAFLGERFSQFCITCQQRFEKNPLRVLDCKIPTCKNLLESAPLVIDSLDDECRAHFESLQALLNQMGIPFVVDGKVVRGLDYYTRTVFEFIGAGLTVIGGGRYDGLIEQVGGTPTAAAGFGMGIERLVLHLQQQSQQSMNEPLVDIFIGSMGECGFAKAQVMAFALRQAGVRVETDLLNRSVKAQMKYADKICTKYACVLGDEELKTGEVQVKNMQTGERKTLVLSDVEAWENLR